MYHIGGNMASETIGKRQRDKMGHGSPRDTYVVACLSALQLAGLVPPSIRNGLLFNFLDFALLFCLRDKNALAALSTGLDVWK